MERDCLLHRLVIMPFYYSYPFLQNEIENIITISNEVDKENMDSKTQLTKEDYINIVKTKRRLFIHELFGDVLETLFRKMKKDADKMRPCHHEAKFNIPDHYDLDKMENVLTDYFKDIGYTSVPEPRKENCNYILLTLT